MLELETPIGVLKVSTLTGPHFDCIWIDLCSKDSSLETAVALVEVDKTEDKPQLITRVYGDSKQPDFTHRIVHKNVDEFFKEAVKND